MTASERRAEVARLARSADAPDEPGDPLDVLTRWRDADLLDDEALALLTDVRAAHRQLRELRLERAWQRSFGWFVARSVVVFAMLVVLGLALAPRAVAFEVVLGALAGVALFYVVIVVTAPLRLRRHAAIRRHVLARFDARLEAFRDA